MSKVIGFFFCVFGICYSSTAQQTLSGQSGHFIVPDANSLGDGGIFVGCNWNPHKYQYLGRPGEHDGEVYYAASVGILPTLDVTLNITRVLNPESVRHNGIGDRSFQFKWRILKETERRPAVAFNGEIPLGINNFIAPNALVLSKKLEKLEVTLGVGSPYLLRRSERSFYGTFLGMEFYKKTNDYLKGLLLAASYRWKLTDDAMLRPGIEFDGEKLNTGVQASWRGWNINVMLIRTDRIAGGISYIGKLK